jgi:hypothetical protein
MAREVRKLTKKQIEKLSEIGRHSDGQGLYLLITKDGSRRWTFLYRHRGKRTELGLGAVSRVSADAARELAQQYRDMLAKGIDPKAARKAEKDDKRVMEGTTFGALADAYIDRMSGHWKSEKSEDAWRLTLGTYSVSIRPLPAASITTDHIVELLRPVWTKSPETARRLRARIEKILDVAKADGWRPKTEENPALLKLIEHKLPPRKRSGAHHAAVDYRKMRDFMGQLRQRQGVACRALEFCILTAARTSEVTGATWGEINLDDTGVGHPVRAHEDEPAASCAPLSARPGHPGGIGAHRRHRPDICRPWSAEEATR